MPGTSTYIFSNLSLTTSVTSLKSNFRPYGKDSLLLANMIAFHPTEVVKEEGGYSSFLQRYFLRGVQKNFAYTGHT